MGLPKALMAAALLVLLVLTTHSNASVAKTTDDTQPVADSRELTGPPFLRGTVSGPNASGAEITAAAWPTDEKLADYEVGDMIPVMPIAASMADKNGAYLLRIDKNAAFQDLASKDGLLDIEVTAHSSDGGQWGSHAMTLDLNGERGEATTTAGAHLRVTTSGEPTSEAAVLDLPLEHAVYTEAATASLPQSTSGCPSIGTRLIQNLGSQRVVVGKAGVGSGVGTAKFTYAHGATSSLGVGVSGTGAYGSFSASGTSSTSSTGTLGFPLVTKKTMKMRTYFRYGKYCTTSRSPGPNFRFSVRSNAFLGGIPHSSGLVSHPSTPRCRPHPKGSDYTKDTTTAKTFGAGAKLGGAIGINLSARTGYTTTAKVFFKFTKNGRLCGTNDFPGGNPGQLVARKP